MKTIISTFVMVLSLVGAPPLFAQMEKPVTFKITHIPAKQGKIMLTTEDGKHYGMTDAIASTAEIKLDGIPNGKYTIYVFHDTNNNYTLDRDADNTPLEYCATQQIEVSDRNKAFRVELIDVKDKKRRAK